ncbi:MAG: dihydrofolate reductase [Prosthecobacter sp.]
MKLIAIVAMSANRVIGRAGKLPWHYPEDLKFFKKTTLGHPVLMGRVTFDSILAAIGKPLPGRQNIVLSRSLEPREDVTILREISELRDACESDETVFVIGGAQIFADLLPRCDGFYLTHIAKEFEGDVCLPPFEHLFRLKEVIGTSGDLEFRYYEALSAA